MSRVVFLSYPYESSTPGYGSSAIRVGIESIKSQRRGDSCNTYRIGLENHLGTHVDGPAHFFTGAQELFEYAAEYWIFHNPLVVKMPLEPEQIVQVEDLQPYLVDSADLLLLNSGWSYMRGEELYSERNPGIAPEVGQWLRENYPNIRAIGFDFVSLASFAHRELGREAHRAFLDPEGTSAPVMIFEDMDLSRLEGTLCQVVAAPWRIKGIDSAPCTIIGWLE